MTISPYLTKNVLSEYIKELNHGRRIARLRRLLRQAGHDIVEVSPEAKRRQMIEQIAREIIENLLTSENNHPIVLEIKADLERKMNQKFIFKYPPPNGDDIHILKEEKNGPVELLPKEREQILQKLWEITIKKVNETMI